jgi:small redox-active disulfide protein 2
MKTIKILGTGCPNCMSTEKIVAAALEESNTVAKVVKVTDIQEIMSYDILRTPAVVVDEKVVIKGRVPTKAEVKTFLY